MEVLQDEQNDARESHLIQSPLFSRALIAQSYTDECAAPLCRIFLNPEHLAAAQNPLA